MKQAIKLYERAISLMREATLQSHTGHWDSQGTGGLNCQECIKAGKLRKEDDEMCKRARNLKLRMEGK